MKLRVYLTQQKTSTLVKLRDWLNDYIATREKVEEFDLDQTLDGIQVRELSHGSKTTPE